MKTNKNLPQTDKWENRPKPAAIGLHPEQAEADGDTILTVLTPHSVGDSFKWQGRVV